MAGSNTPKRPLARLSLMPPFPSPSVGFILEIREADAKTIQVSDPTDNPIQPVARTFDFTTHRFVLRYTTDSERSGWTIEINRDGDSDRFSIKYAFLDRNSASEFQKYVTGYDPGQYEVGENIQCDASIKREWRFGCERFSGIGEIQLWVPFHGPSDENGADTPWPSVPRLAHQPNNTGTSRTFPVVNEGRPPLIVMFLREIGTDRLTMLRMNVRKVNWTLEQTGDMETLNFSHPHHPDKAFQARRCSVPKEDIKKWDACAMARKAPGQSKGIEEITVVRLTLKIRRVPPPPGTPEPLSRLGYLAQQLDEIRMIINGARGTAQHIRRQIESGRIPSRSLASGTSVGDSSDTLLLAHTETASSTGTRSHFTNPMREPARDHRPGSPLEGVQLPTKRESSTRSPSSQAHYSHIDKKSSFSLSRLPSPSPGSELTSSLRVSSIRPLGAQLRTTTVYSPGYGRDALFDVPRTLVEEPTLRHHEHPSSVSADSSDDEDAADSFFTIFDDRVRRALRAEPSISSAAENTIRRLHTLPGEDRALVYDFPTRFPFEGFPETTDVGEGGSLASLSVTSSNSTSGKLFRCPFNVADPRGHSRGGCKGPGFPLSRLADHLERCHLSYECNHCGTDCINDDGLKQHACNMEQIQRVAAATPGRPSDRITDRQMLRIRGMLKPSRKGKIWDEERWFQMWEELFPGVERPEPYFAPRTEMEGLEFRKVEVVFEAMVDADGAGTVISRAKTKLYLRAAMQAVEDQGLERWPLG